MSECISTVGPFPCISILKPWGGYTDIFRSDEVVFKKIVISPGEEISYQQHEKRSEFWYVAEGQGLFRWNNINMVSPVRNSPNCERSKSLSFMR